MADRVTNGPVESPASIREAVCVNTRKIYDSCRDKDCVDDLRVYPTESSQAYIENALNIRPKSAKLLNVDVSVEPVSFNRGYYTVDCTYFYAVTGETSPPGRPSRAFACSTSASCSSGASATCAPSAPTEASWGLISPQLS